MSERDEERERFEQLLERSSLGSAGAQQLRRRTPAIQSTAARRIAELRNRIAHATSRQDVVAPATELIAQLINLGFHEQANQLLHGWMVPHIERSEDAQRAEPDLRNPTHKQSALSSQATHDQLTGLPTRTTLLGDADRLLRALDRHQFVTLLLLDIDEFHCINDTLGHSFGDDILRRIAERLTRLNGNNELLARTGDDEFAILIPQIADFADPATPLYAAPNPMPLALRRARQLAQHLSEPMEVAGLRLAVAMTVGVTVMPAGGADPAELIRRASTALGHAKKEGRAVAAYDPSEDAVTTDNLTLLAELQDALLADDQILLHLQPAVDLLTNEPTGVEALVRWRHPRRGHLAPHDFIDTVEHTELLTPFTDRVLDLALAAANDWKAAGIDLPVSVNMSARSLLDPALPARVADALRRHHAPADRLILEITESSAVSQEPIVDDVLAELIDSGVQLSLDNFGTGHFSLAMVTRVAVDQIKIDRSLVEDMIDLPAAEAVVRSAVELAARLGVRVVANGVETSEQRAALIAAHCPTAQGYYFCRPVPAELIVRVLLTLGDAGENAASTRLHRLRTDNVS